MQSCVHVLLCVPRISCCVGYAQDTCFHDFESASEHSHSCSALMHLFTSALPCCYHKGVLLLMYCRRLCQRHNLSLQSAEPLVSLALYAIVFLCDDSGEPLAVMQEIMRPCTHALGLCSSPGCLIWLQQSFRCPMIYLTEAVSWAVALCLFG